MDHQCGLRSTKRFLTPSIVKELLLTVSTRHLELVIHTVTYISAICTYSLPILSVCIYFDVFPESAKFFTYHWCYLRYEHYDIVNEVACNNNEIACNSGLKLNMQALRNVFFSIGRAHRHCLITGARPSKTITTPFHVIDQRKH